MATNLDIDRAILDEAVEVGHHRTKRAAVEDALKEYIARRKQADVIKLFGTVDYETKYNYKKQRRRP